MMKCERCQAEAQVIVKGIGALCRTDCAGGASWWHAGRVVVLVVVVCLACAFFAAWPR